MVGREESEGFLVGLQALQAYKTICVDEALNVAGLKKVLWRKH